MVGTRILVSLCCVVTIGGAAATGADPAIAGTSSDPTPSAAVTVLDIRFDGGTTGARIQPAGLTNSGTAHVAGKVVSRGTAVAGSPALRPLATYRPGVDATASSAARLPGWVAPDQDPPLAVVSVTNNPVVADPAADPLNPGARPFSWRADFNLDEQSGDESDGDNLFQRGLNPGTLWKIEVDHGRAVCNIRTTNPSTGAIVNTKTAPVHIDRGTWYRAVCARTSQNRLTIDVQKYTDGSYQSVSTAVAPTKVVGSVSMDPATPVSIGGKLRTATTIVTAAQAPSQFNGLVDNAVLTIG